MDSNFSVVNMPFSAIKGMANTKQKVLYTNTDTPCTTCGKQIFYQKSYHCIDDDGKAYYNAKCEDKHENRIYFDAPESDIVIDLGKHLEEKRGNQTTEEN